MSDLEVVRQEQSGLMPVMTVAQAAQKYNVMVEFTKSVMVKDQDFGVIPGVSKPCLYKAGAEKLSSLFGFTPCFSIIERSEDWTGENHGGEPFFYYFYKCQLLRGGEIVGEGDGSCNSWEKKYRYRGGERKCPQCGKASIIVGKQEYGGGFLCFAKKGGCGAKFKSTDPAIIGQDVGVVANPDIAEQVNTLQKMAQKRSLVAAVLIACNASAFYTQDVEDMRTIDVDYETVHETKDEVVERRLAEEKAKAAKSTKPEPPDNPALIKELADFLDTPPDELPPLEAREIGANLHPDPKAKPFFEPTKMVDKAGLEQLKSKPTRKRGAISFEALKKWGEIKKEILRLTGTTDLYYKALAAGGVQHANEIKTLEDAAKIWKALKEITAELKPKSLDAALRLELETYQLAMPGERFMAVLGSNGFEDIPHILEQATGDQLQALLAELKQEAQTKGKV